jgi:hypothetical protein
MIRSLFLIPLALVLGLQLLAPAQSDGKLVGHRLKKFLSSKGASEINNPVQWKIPSTAFQSDPEKLGIYLGFKRSGVWLLVEPGLPDLAIVQRRGGQCRLRGTVIPMPKSHQKKGAPSHGILIRELRYSRK